MLICMRTTVVLPDALAEAAKQRAEEEGRTFTSLLVEALRSLLSNPPEDLAQPAEPLPSYGDPDGRILIDLTDREAVADALDADGLR